jgi:hypothetical protein
LNQEARAAINNPGNEVNLSLPKISFQKSLSDRLKVAMRAKMKTKYIPAARFEDIGKPFY